MLTRVALLSALVVAAGARAAAGARSLQEQARVDASQEDDRVVALPGLGEPIGFGLYSGYVTVDDAAGRALFYILAESPASAADPLVLWLNGGPGCSSVGGGYMSELGPFLPRADGSLARNLAGAWNSVANVLYLDSPAFVGFSYSNSSADAVVGDARTAADGYRFLLGFLSKYPRYAGRPLYLTGESYAGHYIPNLAKAIMDGNARGDEPQINLVGMAIGNPWTDAQIDNYGAASMWWTHNMISTDTFDALNAACNLSAVGPIPRRANGAVVAAVTGSDYDGGDCEAAVELARAEMGPINIYQVLADVCTGAAGAGAAGALARSLAAAGAAAQTPVLAASLLHMRAADASTLRAATSTDSNDGSGFPPQDACIDTEVQAYLNRADVQEALHVRRRPVKWRDCTSAISYSRDDLLSSMLPVHAELLRSGALRVLIYSGDVDGIVPTQGTRAWVEGLGLPVTAPWRPWLEAPPRSARTMRVGGYVVEYDGLTFATVRGAGHMAPYTQPRATLQLFRHFLNPAKPLGAEEPAAELQAAAGAAAAAAAA